MAYDTHLAERVRKILSYSKKKVEEKKMMGGLTFMVDDKMCVGVIKDELVARIGPEAYETELQKPVCRPMDFTGKAMKGFVYITSEGCDPETELKYWIDLALDFNSQIPSKK